MIITVIIFSTHCFHIVAAAMGAFRKWGTNKLPAILYNTFSILQIAKLTENKSKQYPSIVKANADEAIFPNFCVKGKKPSNAKI